MFNDTSLIRQNSSGIKNLSELDGLRGIAILMVMMVHFWSNSGPNGEGFPAVVHVFSTSFDISWFFRSGIYGVHIFFVLSAFLLYLTFAKAINEKKPFVSYRHFITRRILRILPAYYFVIFMYLIFTHFLGRSFYSAPTTKINWFANLFFIQPFVHIFKDGVTMDIIPGTWTLNPEIYFYLLLPVIAIVTKRTPVFIAIITCLLVFPPIYRHFVMPSGDFILSFNILSQIDIFCFGIVLARVYANPPKKIKIQKYSIYLFLLGIFLYFWCWSPYQPLIVDRYFQSGLGCFLFIGGILLNQGNLKKIFQNKILCFLGIVSYSVFLIHDTLVWYFFNLIMDSLGVTSSSIRFGLLMTVGIVLSAIIGYFMYRFIERPFLERKLNPTFIGKRVVISLAAGIAFSFVLYSTAVLAKNGYTKNFIVSSNVTEASISFNPNYQKVWESSKMEDFDILSPSQNVPTVKKEDSGFLVTGNSDWVAIVGKLPDDILYGLKNKQVIISAKVDADKDKLVFAGLTSGKDIFGDPAQKGSNQFVSVSHTITEPIDKNTLIRLNIFPNGTGPFKVNINHFSVYVKK